MQQIEPINKDEFSDKRWKRIDNYSFIAGDTICPITVQELPKVMLEMPIAFTKSEKGFGVVAILGLRPESNAFVDQLGRWGSNYMPAILRSYPFLLANNANEDGQLLFCIDASSGVITDNPDDEPFFNEEGELTDTLQNILNLLAAVYSNRLATEKICQLLDELGLIKPWDLVIELDGDPVKLEGFYSIDEVALNSLSDEDFLRLRSNSALAVAYCQLLSMQKISNIAHRVQQNSGSDASIKVDELTLDSFSNEGNINLDNI